MAMETHPKKREPLDDRAEPAASDLVKLIQKLRWMGMEREAEQLQKVLSRLPESDSVLAAPHDTD
jgi:hypothetical protein